MAAGLRHGTLVGVTDARVDVLTDLAQRVLAAVLEREGEEEGGGQRDPFAAALQRYVAHGAPADLGGRWRRQLGPRGPTEGLALAVLTKLDRDLLTGVVAYATSDEDLARAPAPAADEEDAAGRLQLLGARKELPMPSLELGPDGSWRIAGVVRGAGRAADGRLEPPRPAFGWLRSRYPEPAPFDRPAWMERPAAAPAAIARDSQPLEPPSAESVIALPPAESVIEPPAESVVEPPPAEEAIDPAVAESVREQVRDAEALPSGLVEVVIGPFSRYEQLTRCVEDIGGLEGVEDVRTREIVHGVAHVRVLCADPAALPAQILSVAGPDAVIRAATEGHVEIEIPPSR